MLFQIQSPSPIMKIKNIALFSKAARAVGKLYEIFLGKVVIRLFSSPETAICLASNAMEASPTQMISNYYQGMVLIGDSLQGGVTWKTFPERAIITPETAHIPKRLKGVMRKKTFEIRYNTDFPAVVQACKRDKTWINQPLIDLYQALFDMGCVETIELYKDGQLVGGLWGIVVAKTFGIMSMFHEVNHAGAVALATLVNQLKDEQYEMVDCGVINNNFARYGAAVMPREEFMEKLVLASLKRPQAFKLDESEQVHLKEVELVH